MKNPKQTVYSTNLYNPLTYLLAIIAVIVSFSVSPFVEESFQSIIKSNWRDFKSPKINNPRKLPMILGIVTPVKNKQNE